MDADGLTEIEVPMLLEPTNRIKHFFLVGATPLAFAVSSDAPLAFRAVAYLAMFALACVSLISALSATRVGDDGISVRYGPLTCWLGWQKWWPWDELTSISASGPLRVRPRSGRDMNVFFVGPVAGRWRRSVVAFSDQARVVARSVGVPVLDPKPSNWGPFLPGVRRHP